MIETRRLATQSVALMLLLALLGTGCASRSKNRSDLLKAFRAGEAQGEALAEAKRNGISFTGPVLVPIVPWTEGLTLAQAIVAARWTGIRDPRLIILVNQAGERMELMPEEAEMAGALPMAPGDVVELVP